MQVQQSTASMGAARSLESPNLLGLPAQLCSQLFGAKGLPVELFSSVNPCEAAVCKAADCSTACQARLQPTLLSALLPCVMPAGYHGPACPGAFLETASLLSFVTPA